MVIVVLALAVAITAYVGWLMWNAPEDAPRPPGVSPIQPLLDTVARVRDRVGATSSRAARSS